MRVRKMYHKGADQRNPIFRLDLFDVRANIRHVQSVGVGSFKPSSHLCDKNKVSPSISTKNQLTCIAVKTKLCTKILCTEVKSVKPSAQEINPI